VQKISAGRGGGEADGSRGDILATERGGGSGHLKGMGTQSSFIYWLMGGEGKI
jgi:hypothetical protein